MTNGIVEKILDGVNPQKYLIEYDQEDMAPMEENLTGPDAEQWNYITYETRRNPKKSFKAQQSFDSEESWDC